MARAMTNQCGSSLVTSFRPLRTHKNRLDAESAIQTRTRTHKDVRLYV